METTQEQRQQQEANFFAGQFKFSGTAFQHLVENRYTLVDLLVDLTGSVRGFGHLIFAMLRAVAGKLKETETSANLLLRVVYFNSQIGVKEVHGYRLMENIDPQVDYPDEPCQGDTNLFDAMASGYHSTAEYGRQLGKKRYKRNAIKFLISDADDNDSTLTLSEVREANEQALSTEALETLSQVLIMVNVKDQRMKKRLDELAQAMHFDRALDVEDVAGALDSLTNFVVTTTAETAAAAGTGGKSAGLTKDLNNF